MPDFVNHCQESFGKTGKILWPKTFEGVTQIVTCPKGSVGKATRKCTKSHIWLEENLSSCISTDVHNIQSKAKTSDSSSLTFLSISKSLLSLLTTDTKGKKLSVPGDVPAIQEILELLSGMNLFLDTDLTIASRFEFVDAIMGTVERITDSIYQSIWEHLGDTETLDSLKSFLTLVEDVNLKASGILNPGSHVEYKNSNNRNFHVQIKTMTQAQFAAGVTYPSRNSPEYQIEKSTIELPANLTYAASIQHNSTLRISFVRYNTFNKLVDHLMQKLSSVTGRTFNDRKLNSVLVGAQVTADNKEDKKLLQFPVKITFQHIRRSKNPMCVYADLRKGKWLFSEEGCYLERSNGYRTICLCYHLSLFAVLTHDLLDEEVLHAKLVDKFRLYIYHISLSSLAICTFLLVLIIIPRNFKSSQTILSCHINLSMTLRHIAVIFALYYPQYEEIAWTASAILIYTCVVNSLQPNNRILAILHDLSQEKSTPSILSTTWLLPLVMPGLVMGIYFYGKHRGVEITNEMAFSLEVFAPSLVVICFMLSIALVQLVWTGYFFTKTSKQLEPITANRLDCRLWIAGASFIHVISSIYFTLICFLDLGLPSHEMQICYAVATAFELLCIINADLRLNVDIATYYQKLIGTKPLEEKVKVDPPKYIP